MLKGFIFIMTVCLTVCGFSETVKIGFFEMEPYVIKQADGKFTGASVEYFEEYIAPKMDVKVEWIGPVPMSRLQKSLENSEFDAALILAKNSEREKKYLYPAHYYLLMKPSITLLKTNPLENVTKPEDLYNLKLGFLEGGLITPFVKNEKIVFEYTIGTDYARKNLDKMLLKRIDAMYNNNDLTDLYVAKQNGAADKVKNILLPVEPTMIYTAFTKSKRGEKLVKLYDSVNNGLYNTDTFNKIVAKYK